MSNAVYNLLTGSSIPMVRAERQGLVLVALFQGQKQYSTEKWGSASLIFFIIMRLQMNEN